MLDDLVSVIETLKQRIRTHGATLRANEIRTRVALIDPLLVALGWDVSDPVLVTPEYAVGEGRADYALHGSESIPAAMVEAKRLGHALSDDERMQMLNYANARGVRYAAVTDGDVWEFYEVFKQAPLEDRRQLSLRIANTPAHELALQLLLLWRPNLASGQPVTASEPILGMQSRPPTSVPLPEAPPENPVGYPPPEKPVPHTVEVEWRPLSEYNPPVGTNPPSAMRFPDGTTVEVVNWKQITMLTAEWLHEQRLLTADNLPVLSGHRGFAANSEPVHRNGSPMVTYESIGTGGVFINVHLSAKASRENAKKLLQHCVINPATVQLQVGQ